jgi:hypothetical protein
VIRYETCAIAWQHDLARVALGSRSSCAVHRRIGIDDFEVRLRVSRSLRTATVGWTLLLAAVLATVLTTDTNRAEHDEEAPWLPWMLLGVWLAGIVLLAIAVWLLKRRR